MTVTLATAARTSPAIAVFREPTVLVVGIDRRVVVVIMLRATIGLVAFTALTARQRFKPGTNLVVDVAVARIAVEIFS